MGCILSVLQWVKDLPPMVLLDLRPNTTIARCHVSKTFQVLNYNVHSKTQVHKIRSDDFIDYMRFTLFGIAPSC